jgi:hypothetical protein
MKLGPVAISGLAGKILNLCRCSIYVHIVCIYREREIDIDIDIDIDNDDKLTLHQGTNFQTNSVTFMHPGKNALANV